MTTVTSSLLTSDDIAARFHMTRQQVSILCRTGDLRASKIGRRWLVDPADMQAYLDERANRTRRQRRRRAA